MKKLVRLLFVLTITCLFSCKKAVENKQRELLIDAITNGQWVVQQYIEGTVDITLEFYGHSFQFQENGSVHGMYGSSSVHGTWYGDINNYSIISEFPSATDPIKKLNGTWKLTDSYWDFVEAEMNTATGKNILHLRKKP